MSGPSGDWHQARRRHLRVCREEVWGQCPDNPAWRAVPIFGDGFKLKAANPRFRPDTLYGGYRSAVQLSHVRRVAGLLVTLPWPEAAALLLEMALERDGGALRSYCMDYCTPTDPRRCLGVMVDGLDVIAAGGDVRFRFALRAKAEEANPTLTEEDFDYAELSPVPFVFGRATISLAGTPLCDVEALTLAVRNDLLDGPNRAGAIAFLAAGRRTVGLELTKLDNTDALNAAIRDAQALSFQMTLTHPDGHSLDVTVPALHIEASEETATPGELAHAVPRGEAGTDAQGDDITYTLNLNA